jgi:hypothetical protein
VLIASSFWSQWFTSKACSLLSELVWKYQIIPFEDLIFSLVRGELDSDQPECSASLKFLEYLLLTSNELKNRVELFLNGLADVRHWHNQTYSHSLRSYLLSYAEYFEFQALVIASANESFQHAPPKPLPQYFGNICLRMMPVLDHVLCRLIEFGRGDLATALIGRYQRLYSLHPARLLMVHNLMVCYKASPVMNDPDFVRKFFALAGKTARLFFLFFSNVVFFFLLKSFPAGVFTTRLSCVQTSRHTARLYP